MKLKHIVVIVLSLFGVQHKSKPRPRATAPSYVYYIWRTNSPTAATQVPSGGYWNYAAINVTGTTYTDVPGAGTWWYTVEAALYTGSPFSQPATPYVKVTTTATNKVVLNWQAPPIPGVPNAPTGILAKSQ